MEHLNTFYTSDRLEWRMWLAEHFETEQEVWFVFPMKSSGEEIPVSFGTAKICRFFPQKAHISLNLPWTVYQSGRLRLNMML